MPARYLLPAASAMSQNFAEMLVDGHRILPSLLSDIAAAKDSIHISVFLFFRDPIGEEIADALARGRISRAGAPPARADASPALTHLPR